MKKPALSNSWLPGMGSRYGEIKTDGPICNPMGQCDHPIFPSMMQNVPDSVRVVFVIKESN